MTGQSPPPVTLALDIGASVLKGILLDGRGKPMGEPLHRPTPTPSDPESLLSALDGIVVELSGFDRISIGFPGIVRKGTVSGAFNLSPGWEDMDLSANAENRWGKPVRIANDADVQGLGTIQGRGVEVVLTLGTGLGSSLFHHGRLVPNLELGHLPFKEGRTFEDLLGQRGLDASGREVWRRNLDEAIGIFARCLSFDRLWLGGGNARLCEGGLPKKVELGSNQAGLLGGFLLWKEWNP